MENNTRISVTPSVARQSPKGEFGQVLSNSINGALAAGGTLLGALPGMPIISSAVSAVSALAHSGRSSAGATSVVNLAGGPATGPMVAGGGMRPLSQGVETPGMNDMLSSMRSEADRSLMVQMQMQTESREYNTLTNILKLRHDSAKAAINNIR